MKQAKKKGYIAPEMAGALTEAEQNSVTAEPGNTNGKAEKRPYIAPEITVTYIQLEEGIATGSATVKTTNTAGQVKDEWDVQPDKTGTFTW